MKTNHIILIITFILLLCSCIGDTGGDKIVKSDPETEDSNENPGIRSGK